MKEQILLPKPEDRYDEKLLLDIEEVGWGIIGIPAEDDNPGFAFTAGLYYSYGHPEIILFGINYETSKLILNQIGFKIKNGSQYESNKYYDELFENYQAYFHYVDEEHYKEHLGQAGWLYKNMDKIFPCLQLVWPDRSGCMPWEKDYDENYVGLQTLLFNNSIEERV